MLTLYTQQVLKLAQVYHTSVGEQERYSKFVLHWFLVGNCCVVVFQLGVWCAYFETQGSVDPDVWSVVAASGHAVSFAVAAGALAWYCSLNDAFLSKLSLGVEERRAQLKQSLLLSVPCTAALLVRALALAAASWANLLDWNSVRETVTAGDAAASIIVYVFTEIMPLGAILYFNRLRGRTRVQFPGEGGGSAAAAAALLLSSKGDVSPSAVRPLRFNFSPKKNRMGMPGEAVGGPEEPQQPPLPNSGSMKTGKVVQGLFGMVTSGFGPFRIMDDIRKNLRPLDRLFKIP